MNKVILSTPSLYPEDIKKTAVEKPVADIEKVLADNCNFKVYTAFFPFLEKSSSALSKFIRSVKFKKRIDAFLKMLPPDSLLVLQYPMKGQSFVLNTFDYICNRIAGRNDITSVIIVHDLLSRKDIKGKITEEAKGMEKISYIVVHNRKMKQLLIEANPDLDKNKVIELELFDYLIDNDTDKKLLKNITTTKLDEKNISICYAGNLSKAPFLRSLPVLSNFKFYCYGPFLENIYKPTFIHKGSLSTEDILLALQEYNYGLVWDGKSTETLNEDDMGIYIQYNNPYKLSCYLAAGIPVITHKNAAIAEFIESNNIGITVNSLQELDGLHIKEEIFRTQRDNVIRIRKKVISGGYTIDAISKIAHRITINQSI